MPPRYAYWTIIVDNQPTAFRSGSQEELMPTFNRLKAKNDTAVMMWFQIGKLWPSRIDAQEFMRARGEHSKTSRPQDLKTSRSPRSAWTPRGEPSTPAPKRNADAKLDWKPKGEFVPAPKRAERPDWKSKPSRSEKPDWKPRDEKPEWKPKGSFTPAPRRSEGSDWKPKGSFDRERKPSPRPFDREERPRSFKRPNFKSSGDDTRSAKPEWKPKGSFTPAPRRSEGSDWKSKPARTEKPEWKPKGSFDRERKPEWKPNRDVGGRFSSPGGERAPRGEKPEWKPKGSFDRAPSRSERPEWKPKSQAPTPDGEKRKWVPKEEYKRSMGIEAKRDSKWRPGGEHKDPRQKYKDAKKAKWTKFKKAIRTRSDGKKNKP